jgi:hypothetical protein
MTRMVGVMTTGAGAGLVRPPVPVPHWLTKGLHPGSGPRAGLTPPVLPLLLPGEVLLAGEVLPPGPTQCPGLEQAISPVGSLLVAGLLAA